MLKLIVKFKSTTMTIVGGASFCTMTGKAESPSLREEFEYKLTCTHYYSKMIQRVWLVDGKVVEMSFDEGQFTFEGGKILEGTPFSFRVVA
jgi:hypothetical protein